MFLLTFFTFLLPSFQLLFYFINLIFITSLNPPYIFYLLLPSLPLFIFFYLTFLFSFTLIYPSFILIYPSFTLIYPFYLNLSLFYPNLPLFYILFPSSYLLLQSLPSYFFLSFYFHDPGPVSLYYPFS